MKTVHKFRMEDDHTSFLMHPEAAVVSVEKQNGDICIWVETPFENESVVTRSFQIFGTGHAIPDKSIHCGSVQDAPFVWHLYEVFN